ncbi:MAG: hypothetical protein ABIH85_00160 [Candidatus Omnitrophota bacterium]
MNFEKTAKIRNRLTASKTVLEKLSEDKSVPKKLIRIALKDLGEVIKLLNSPI